MPVISHFVGLKTKTQMLNKSNFLFYLQIIDRFLSFIYFCLYATMFTVDRDGAVVRALDSRSRCHIWVEFVVGSRPCSEGFSPGSPVFLPPQKPTLPNSIWNQWSKSHSVEVPLQIPIYLFNLFIQITLTY